MADLPSKSTARIPNVSQVLILSRTELIERLKLTEKDINSLLLAASKSVMDPEPVSAFDIWSRKCDKQLQHSKVSLGCNLLNSALRGGLLLPGINEIAGESGSGKTQLCLQLCLTSQLPNESGGLSGGALFVSTEDAFPTKRLHQLAESFQRKFNNLKNNFMDNIFIEHAADIEDLWTIVTQRIPALLSRTNVKLIIIDSIAALFRVEYTVNEAIERSKALASFGAQVRKISCNHRAAIVCVNQPRT